MPLKLIKMYKFIEPLLKFVTGLMVNRTSFALLVMLARFYMFLLLCMAFIFYTQDRLDGTAAFTGFVFLIHFCLKLLGRNLWKIERWISGNFILA